MEIWKKINNFPDYEVSNFGEVKRVKHDSFNRELKILKVKEKSNGYFEIQLWRNRKCKYKLIVRTNFFLLFSYF